MMLLFSLMLSLLAAAVPANPGTVIPCKTVADCWLDKEGKPIPRPRAKRGRPIPSGDCGKNLLWLRTRLSCEQQVCVAVNIGDAC